MIKSRNVIRAIFLCTMLLLLMFNVKAYAATDDNRLKNNENVTWTFDEKTGTLVIEGTGKANINGIDVPKNDVKKLVVKKGITYFSGAKNYKNLAKVKLSSSVKTIGKSAFQKCVNLKSITGLRYVKIIGPWAFVGCTKLKNVVLGDSLVKIGESAFWRSGLLSINIPDSVCEIGSYAFENTPIKTAKLPLNLEVIENHLFYRCTNLTNITLPKKLKKIEEHAFYDCNNLKISKLPNSVEFIGSYAFLACDGIDKIIIPSNVIEIGKNTFLACSNLKCITVKSTKMTKSGIEGLECFNRDNPKLPVLKLPKKVARKYKKWINSYYDNAYEDTIEDLKDFPPSFPQKIVTY